MIFGSSLRKQAGFTLVELLVVIAIAGILATLAGPSFTDLIARTKLNSESSQLVSALNRARSEAIKRNTTVLVCARGSDTACSNLTNWQNGWLVCVGNTSCDAGTASNPNPITIHPAFPGTFTLTSTVAKLQFKSNGTSGTGAESLTLGLGGDSRVIAISVTGSISRP